MGVLCFSWEVIQSNNLNIKIGRVLYLTYIYIGSPFLNLHVYLIIIYII
jgi:hypothetical protein